MGRVGALGCQAGGWRSLKEVEGIYERYQEGATQAERSIQAREGRGQGLHGGQRSYGTLYLCPTGSWITSTPLSRWVVRLGAEGGHEDLFTDRTKVLGDLCGRWGGL